MSHVWRHLWCLCQIRWCSLCCCMLFVYYVWECVVCVLTVMCVVGGVPLWVECVFRRVDDVCLFMLYTQLLF